VARDDAAAGKRMFLFLGLPGVLMAAFLAAYAGGILAAAQRREHAILRVRGAHREHLRRIAIYEALAFAGAGSAIGIALGLASAAAALGWATFSHAAPGDLAVSALISFGAGAAITALALYVPARRSVAREVGQERREMQVGQVPAWRRLRLDLALLAVGGVVELVAVRTGALKPPSGSVYSGVAVSLPSRLLLTPLIAWLGGLLLFVRLPLAIAARLPTPSTRSFGPVVGGVVSRSLRRRPWALASGIIGLGLVVAFGTSLAIFGATYDAAKAADSRFVVGSDLRITPSVVSAQTHPQSFASELMVGGVSGVSPVVFGLENSVLIGPNNQRAENLAAIDSASFARVAPLPDSLFVDGSAAGALGALEADPQGFLVDEETADDLQVDTSDTVDIILALGTKRETLRGFHVVGVFTRFPGFPEGANLIVNLDRYEKATGAKDIDFFLADVTDDGPTGVDRAVASLRSGPGSIDPIHIDSTRSVLDQDQSSLTALNVNGLLGLDALYVFLLSAATIAMFVFGLMLQRRREYVILQAQGLRIRELHVLVLAEAAFVTVCGLAAGLLVGSGIAFLLVQILRGLFVLDPTVALPVARIVLLAALVLVATVASALAATEILRRLRPTEILREE
jgi:putative ABC transport system permease protein